MLHYKPILTITPSRLRVLGKRLLQEMSAAGFAPEVAVAIARGGVWVADEIPFDPSVRRYQCNQQRPGTARKQGERRGRALRRMPLGALNTLRRLEDLLGERRSLSVAEPSPELTAQLKEIAADIRVKRLRKVVVIDDAVDSGKTMQCVLRILTAELGDDVSIMTAALVATRPPRRSLLEPDFALYRDVLLRFPWSTDYVGAKP
ncbi:hypothetical protein AB4Z14_03500 [Terrabacter sp. 2TAF16]